MRIPRDITGDDLVRLLAPLGYRVTRQTGSHMRLTTPAAETAVELDALLSAILDRAFKGGF